MRNNMKFNTTYNTLNDLFNDYKFKIPKYV